MAPAPTSSPGSSLSFRTFCGEWVTALAAGLNRQKWVVFSFIAVILLTGGVERSMGRSLLGPDGKFGWWEGGIWSNECSQRFADPYSLSHVAHGMVFYGGLWLVARRLPVRRRFLLAVLLEAGWEVLENSPLIIERYRQVTIALGYDGDSVLNSLSDVFMMSLGFLLALRFRPWITVAGLAAMELGCALWIHDNLTLNIIMLVHPVEAIKAWQMTGRPPL